MNKTVHDKIEHLFSKHEVSEDQLKRMDEIRNKIKACAGLLAELCPESAELTIALRHLQQARHFANEAIVLNEE